MFGVELTEILGFIFNKAKTTEIKLGKRSLKSFNNIGTNLSIEFCKSALIGSLSKFIP